MPAFRLYNNNTTNNNIYEPSLRDNVTSSSSALSRSSSNVNQYISPVWSTMLYRCFTRVLGARTLISLACCL